MTTVDKRTGILGKKKLCFNCAGPKHRVNECRSKIVGQKHYTSICVVKGSLHLATGRSANQVVYPMVDVDVEGGNCRAWD